ncbi:MAG: hypothetical protein C0507_13990 [Cyanobacteria bacterium PR.3.49]|nr:hypothetical protein [Cyanobacteria bacterium PR.3.49]
MVASNQLREKMRLIGRIRLLRYLRDHPKDAKMAIVTWGPGGTIVNVIRLAAGIASSRAAGSAGEFAAGITKAKTAIDSVTQTALRRFPDMVTQTQLIEVKNTANLYGSRMYNQLLDSAQYAYEHGLEMVLVTRHQAPIPPTTQSMLNAYGVQVKDILPK